MSFEYAELIMTATGIDHLWLLGRQGSRNSPTHVHGGPYTPASFVDWRKKGGQKFWIEQRIDDKFETVSIRMRRIAWELIRLAVAAARANRFDILVHHFNKFVQNIKVALRLQKIDDLKDVSFLPNNLLNARPITFPDDSDNGIDSAPTSRIVATFNPVFLFELDSAKADDGQKKNLSKRLDDAQESLNLLRKLLSQ